MNKNSEGLYFDDIKVGQKFLTSSYEISEKEIVEFAKQFDPQPFHLSNEGARDTLFEELAASGWHTGAVTMRLIIGDKPPIAGGVISRGGEISWLKPVRVGDVLRVESEVVEKIKSKSNPSRGTIIIRCETINQNDEVVQIMKANLIAQSKD